ncbi:MAG: hypothetical protein WDO18_03150 [Acidobacteriota bacterium]
MQAPEDAEKPACATLIQDHGVWVVQCEPGEVLDISISDLIDQQREQRFRDILGDAWPKA